MDHEKYMKLAIEIAKDSEKERGAAIGAVLVKSGEVIAVGKSLVSQNNDPSGHAETNCIRNACKRLGVPDLDNCTLYGTLEPCAMCLSAAAWANLPEIYFGAYREDVVGNEYEVKNWSSERAAKEIHLESGKQVKVTGGIMREECAELLKDYKGWRKINS